MNRISKTCIVLLMLVGATTTHATVPTIPAEPFSESKQQVFGITPDGAGMFAVSGPNEPPPAPLNGCINAPWYELNTWVVTGISDLKLRAHVTPMCVLTSGKVGWRTWYFTSQNIPKIVDRGSYYEVTWDVQSFEGNKQWIPNGKFTIFVKKSDL